MPSNRTAVASSTTKRVVDILVSAVTLLIMSPFLILAMLLVRLNMGSPVFYKQRRPGYLQKPFVLYKLRTMKNELRIGDRTLTPEDRVTPLGHFLRQTSLDEIPQFWNVLKGDMSLVGPRPLLMEYLPLYTKKQSRRHEARPGITGLAQIQGRNYLSWEEKFEFDIWYIDNWSLGLDFKILWRTPFKVMRSEGVNHGGTFVSSRFRGSKSNPPQ